MPGKLQDCSLPRFWVGTRWAFPRRRGLRKDRVSEVLGLFPRGIPQGCGARTVSGAGLPL
jgi:hypothetical protein